MPAPANFDDLSRSEQLAYIYSTYGGSIEDRQRAAGGAPVLTSPKFRANNIKTADYVTPEERALWGRVKSDGGTWLGNALHEAAPYALAAGLAYAGGTAISNGLNAGNVANASNLGIFANGGEAGLVGVGGGNAGALAASGGIAGGAGIGGTTAGALGGLSGVANTVSRVGGKMGWSDWIGPAVNAGLSLWGGKKANDATTAAARAALGENARQFDLVRSDTAPARALGTAAIGTLADLNGYNATGTPNMSRFTASPDYQFNLTEGQKAIDRSAAARGGLLSGGAVKEGARYTSGLASREYGSFVDRLMQQAGLGSNGNAASAAAGANSAANVSNIQQNMGNARGSTYMDTAANVNNAFQSGYSNQLLRRYLGG